MRIVEQCLYRFDELSDKAKKNAIEQFREFVYQDFAWVRESQDSINAFCDFFGVSLNEWDVNPWGFDFVHDAKNDNFRGIKLKKIDRNYMPTGYCLDCSLWVTFHDKFRETGSAKKAFNFALNKGFKDWSGDLAYQISEDAIVESILINEYEFDESGEFQ